MDFDVPPSYEIPLLPNYNQLRQNFTGSGSGTQYHVQVSPPKSPKRLAMHPIFPLNLYFGHVNDLGIYRCHSGGLQNMQDAPKNIHK